MRIARFTSTVNAQSSNYNLKEVTDRDARGRGRFVLGSEAPFTCTRVLTTALRLEAFGGVVAAAAAAVIIKYARCSRWFGLRFVDAQRSATELITIKFLDRLGRDGGIVVLDKCEATGTARLTIHRDKDFSDLTDLTEELFELRLCGREWETSYKQLSSDVDILLAISRPQCRALARLHRSVPYGISPNRATKASGSPPRR